MRIHSQKGVDFPTQCAGIHSENGVLTQKFLDTVTFSLSAAKDLALTAFLTRFYGYGSE